MIDLDFSDSINIKITKVKDCVGFSHWEGDLYIGDEETASCTAPDFLGVVDNLLEYLYDEKSEWVKDNANERK